MKRKQDVYVPGAHNLTCDRTGFKIKSTDARKEWNGLIVRGASYEPRHPQDFVRAVHDRQAVQDARPGAAKTYLNTNTTLDADELPGQTVLSVASTDSYVVGQIITIDLDNDEKHLSTITAISAGDTVTIALGLPSKASSGNAVSVQTSTVTH